MAQRRVYVFDDFNRTDADPAGSPWVLQNGTSGNIKIVSNQVLTSSGVANGAEVVHDAQSPWLDQFVRLSIPTFTPTLNDGADAGALFRTAGGSVRQFYSVVAIEQGNGGFSTQVAKRVAGTFTSLATDNTGVWASGDEFYAECTGKNPTTIKVWRNGVLVLSMTDSESTLQTYGKTGIRLRPITGASDCIVDNFLTGVPGALGRFWSGLTLPKPCHQQHYDLGLLRDTTIL